MLAAVPEGAWPWATFAINITGSALLGAVPGVVGYLRADRGDRLRLLLGVGVLGGFTTYSAFALHTVRLVDAGRPVAALVHAAGSVLLGVAAAALAHGLVGGRRRWSA